MSNALTQYQSQTPAHAHALEPQNIGEAMTIAVDLAKSGLFQHLGNPGAVFAVLAKGRELGLPMMAALTEINVIKGKVSLSAAAMIGVCVSKKDVCEFFTCVESDDKHAVYKTKRKGADEERHTFTIEDAQRLGVSGNDNYKKQPATMLRWRCASALARRVYPDLLAGCYTPEEAESITDDEAPERVSVAVEPAKAGPAALGLGTKQEAPKVKRNPVDDARAKIQAATSHDPALAASIALLSVLEGIAEDGPPEVRSLIAARAGEMVARLLLPAQTQGGGE
jgi:hypothetical protein